MPAHETKRCERCNAVFECKPGNITQCQCFGVAMSDAAKQYIADKYRDCLCRNCLLQVTEEIGQA